MTAGLTVAAFGIVAFSTARATTLDAAGTRLKSALSQLAAITELGVVNQVESITAAALHPAVIEALRVRADVVPDEARATLARLQGTDPTVVVELVDRNGGTRLTLPRGMENVLAPDMTPIPAEAGIGPIREEDGVLSFVTTSRVLSGGVPVGGIRVTRRLRGSSANRRITNNVLGTQAILLVGNRDGTVWDDSGSVQYPQYEEAPVRLRHGNRDWVSASRVVKGTPWLFAVAIPEEVALAPAHALLLPFSVAGILVAIAGALVGASVSRRITTPLADLTSATEAIARGEANVSLASAAARDDEIGRLARSFDTMAASVRGVRERLESEIDTRTGELSSAVTRLRQLHEELRQTERFATLGRLSGSVGHELRNPLGVMSNVVFLLEAMPDASPKLKDYAGLLREQIRLSDRIISDLLDRARSGAPVRSTVEVTRLLDDILTRVELPPNIAVVRRGDADVPPLVLDRDQVGQILWNLVTNAVQAMQGGGGTLAVSTTFAADRLRFEVRDTGAGIPLDDAERIFEPTFTTKVQGVGLGLCISRAFARANGGDLTVLPDDGCGARFVLEVEATVASPEDGDTPRPGTTRVAPQRAGR